MEPFRFIPLVLVLGACKPADTVQPSGVGAAGANATAPQDDGAIGAGAKRSLPLALVADVDLPGKAVRFDYQDLDVAKKHLVIAHMNDASVVVVNTSDGATAKVLSGIPTARGIVVADDVGRIFVTSSPSKLVIIDNDSLTEIGRVGTGRSPDGVAWDPKDKIVGVSDQGDGAVSLIGESGSGARKQVPLGTETGNVVYDGPRGIFWVTVVKASPPDQ